MSHVHNPTHPHPHPHSDSTLHKDGSPSPCGSSSPTSPSPSPSTLTRSTSSSRTRVSHHRTFACTTPTPPHPLPLQRRSINIFDRLMSRQWRYGMQHVTHMQQHTMQQQFAGFRLKATSETHLDGERRSKIVEIVAIHEFVIVLNNNGKCHAFKTGPRLSPICCINYHPDQVIRSLFYNNTEQDALITVAVNKEDGFNALRCRSIPIESIRWANPRLHATPLFVDETLYHPGFVELDDVNKKVVTFCAQTHVYKIWSLATYQCLWELRDPRIAEIKISPGIVVLIYQRQPGHLPLSIVSIADGSVLHTVSHLLHRAHALEFVESMNDKIYIKQKNENMQIYHLLTRTVTTVEQSRVPNPSSFVFLYDAGVFLTFRDRIITVWNEMAELVTRFEDHLLWNQESNNIYITPNQSILLSYCRSREQPDSKYGSLNISSIKTGACLAKICHQQIEQQQRAEAEHIVAEQVQVHAQQQQQQQQHQNNMTADMDVDSGAGAGAGTGPNRQHEQEPPTTPTSTPAPALAPPTVQQLAALTATTSASSSASSTRIAPRPRPLVMAPTPLPTSVTARLLGQTSTHTSSTYTSSTSTPTSTSTSTSTSISTSTTAPAPAAAPPSKQQLMDKAARDALRGITALFYDVERNEIYTGNKNGMLHAWSN